MKINEWSDWMFMFWEETTVQRRNFPNPQPLKFTCSKLFNLTTDVGTTNQRFNTTSQENWNYIQHQKSLTGKTELKEHQRYTAYPSEWEFSPVHYKYVQSLYVSTYLRKNYPLEWEFSLVHYKRGYSGPGQLGEFVVALFLWSLGAPSNLIYATLFEDFYVILCMTLCWNCVKYKKRSHMHMLYVQNICVYKMLYLIF